LKVVCKTAFRNCHSTLVYRSIFFLGKHVQVPQPCLYYALLHLQTVALYNVVISAKEPRIFEPKKHT